MKRGLLFLVLALLATWVSGDTARAAYDPVARGTTTIALSHEFTSSLAKHGVKVRVRDGRLRAGRIVLQAEGGEFDPHLGTGTVESQGTILLESGSRKVILRSIVFKAKRAPLYAKVGGGQLKLATGARLTDRRVGFGAAFAASGLRLSEKLASRLNKKLRLGRELMAGEPLANVKVDVQPTTVHLEAEGRFSLAFDPGFASKLDQLFVSLNPVAPAELTAGPTLSFPIGLESTLSPDGSSGTVKLGGQAELLQLGHAQMFWREVWWQPAAGAVFAETDVEPSPPQAGVAPQGALLSTSSGGAVSSDPGSRTISISSGSLALTASTAASLNAAFGHQGAPEFSAGEAIGSFSVDGSGE